MDHLAAIEAIERFSLNMDTLKAHIAALRRHVEAGNNRAAAIACADAAVESSGMAVEMLKLANLIIGGSECPSA